MINKNRLKVIMGLLMTMPFVLRPIVINIWCTIGSVLIAIIGALIALDGLEKSV
jgi:hypothetical protein